MSEKDVRQILSEQALEEMEKLARKFAPGGDCGPIEDRYEYEKGIEALPPEEGELVRELTRLAELTKYLKERGERLGREILEEVKRFPNLPLPERIAAVREINRKLMERIPDGGDGAGIRV